MKQFKTEDVDINIQPYEKIQDVLIQFIEKEQGRIWISHNSNYGLVSLIPEKRRFTQICPVAPLKAIKNNTEIQGSIY